MPASACGMELRDNSCRAMITLCPQCKIRLVEQTPCGARNLSAQPFLASQSPIHKLKPRRSDSQSWCEVDVPIFPIKSAPAGLVVILTSEEIIGTHSVGNELL